MNKVLFFIVFFLAVTTVQAQRIYFIYLQTESQQPFFVKLDEKIHSSTATGYLILSRLRDSTYSFSLGFAGSGPGTDEQKFTCSINKKDHGYVIKKFGDKGWGLVDVVTASILMAEATPKKDASSITVPVNAFTNLLALAADDPTLKQKNVIPEEKKGVMFAAKKEDVVPSPAKTADNVDTVKKTVVVPAAKVIKQKEEVRSTGYNKPGKNMTTSEKISLPASAPPTPIAAVKQDADSTKATESTAVSATSAPMITEQVTETYMRSRVVRKSESSTTEGLGLTYIDSYADGSQDTIRLMIPETNQPRFTESVITDTVAKNVVEEKATDRVLTTTTEPAAGNAKDGVKKNCKEIATDADFYRLRKKMAGEKSDVAMLDEAKKSFRTKCFTTGQIKNLGSLFLGDGGKYYFFDAAHQHIADADNFTSLQSELKDTFFINRFKAITK